MYLDHWNLKEKPFSNTPDQHFLYYSPTHEEALTRMLYVATQGVGALLLTGGIGCGKTLISRVFIHELNAKKYDIALITNPALSAKGFIKEILYQLGINCQSDDKIELIHLLNDTVFRTSQEGRHTILIIDEAQLIKDHETFEEIRLLLNFQQNDKFYISLVLMGQPELRERIEAIPQLKQRLGIRFHLKPLSASDTKKYIEHRLNIAGATKILFTDEAIKITFLASRGIPRQINNICDMALLVGFGLKSESISGGIIKQVIRDLEGKI